MLSSIAQICDRLVAEYDPDRIIVYGSYAAGTATSESDIDLVLVKDTALKPSDRRAEVERLLQDRAVAIDVSVYTPEELRRLFAMGSPFVEQVMNTGRVLYMRKAVASWLKDAADEMSAAEILLDHTAHKGACYHAQQAVEKALKSLILERGDQPGRVHDIIKLLRAVEDLGWRVDIDVDDAVFLNSVYKGRYPTDDGLLPHGEPTAQEAGRAVDAASRCLASVKKLLAQ